LVNLEELFGEDFGDLMPIVGDFSPAAEVVLGPIDAIMKDDHAGAAPLPSVQGAEEHGDGCPNTKEDIVRLITDSEQQTFGPPLADTVSQFVPAEQKAAEEEICPFAADLGLTEPLSKVDPNVPSVPIGEAWKQVKSSPHFEDCDIDELCTLLKEQARCSGGKPVIEEQNFTTILQKMGTHRTA